MSYCQCSIDHGDEDFDQEDLVFREDGDEDLILPSTGDFDWYGDEDDPNFGTEICTFCGEEILTDFELP